MPAHRSITSRSISTTVTSLTSGFFRTAASTMSRPRPLIRQWPRAARDRLDDVEHLVRDVAHDDARAAVAQPVRSRRQLTLCNRSLALPLRMAAIRTKSMGHVSLRA